MNKPKNKFQRTMIKHLRVLASQGNEDLNPTSAMDEFLKLHKMLEEPAVRDQLVSSQLAAIERVIDEMHTITRMPKGILLFADEPLIHAPEWEPMRQAARDAIEALEA